MGFNLFLSKVALKEEFPLTNIALASWNDLTIKPSGIHKVSQCVSSAFFGNVATADQLHIMCLSFTFEQFLLHHNIIWVVNYF